MPGEEAALAQLGGGLINSAGALWGAAQNRKWSEKMSDSAHQREVKDLIAAGLNPIMSVNKGASTPNAETINPGAGLGQGLAEAGRTMAIDAARIKNETALAQANSAKAEAETRNTEANTQIALQEAGRGGLKTEKLQADIASVGQGTKTSSAQEAATWAGIPKTKAEVGLINANKTKAEAEAAVLKAVAPFLTRGLGAIQQMVDAAASNGKLGDDAARMVEAISQRPDVAAYLAAKQIHGIPQIAMHLVDLIAKYAPQVLDSLKSGGGESAKQFHENFNKQLESLGEK